MIHRKNTIKKLNEEVELIHQSDIKAFQLALELIEHQEELLKKLGKKIKNLRENNKNLSRSLAIHKAINIKLKDILKEQTKISHNHREELVNFHIFR